MDASAPRDSLLKAAFLGGVPSDPQGGERQGYSA
jgi:hypothetical protein